MSKKRYTPIEYHHYQPNNLLTIHFRKLIEKDINNNTIVYPTRDGSRRKPKKRSNLNKKGGVYDK